MGVRVFLVACVGMVGNPGSSTGQTLRQDQSASPDTEGVTLTPALSLRERGKTPRPRFLRPFDKLRRARLRAGSSSGTPQDDSWFHRRGGRGIV